jgi:hypothetical protein
MHTSVKQESSLVIRDVSPLGSVILLATCNVNNHLEFVEEHGTKGPRSVGDKL